MFELTQFPASESTNLPPSAVTWARLEPIPHPSKPGVVLLPARVLQDPDHSTVWEWLSQWPIVEIDPSEFETEDVL